MIYFLKNKFFRNIFLSYALLMCGLILLFFVIFIYQTNLKQEEKMYQMAKDEAELMVQMLDNKFSDIEVIATQINASNWGKYMNANSEILYSKVDYFDKKEICQIVDAFNALLGIAKSTAIVNTKKNIAVDDRSFWESERYFKSVGLTENFLEKMIENVETNYYSLMFCKENDKLVAMKRLDNTRHPKVILISILDDKLFQRFLKINMPNVEQLSLRLDQDEMYSYVKYSEEAETTKSYEITINSNMYQWEYVFHMQVRNYEESGYETWIYVLSYFGMVLLTLILAYGLTRYTYRPIQKVVGKMNIYPENHLNGLEEIEHIYENLKNENEMLENIGIQYYEIGKSSVLISLLKGNYDKKHIEERMNQFHICFRTDMSYLVTVITNVGANGYQEFIDELRKLQNDGYHQGIYTQMFHMNENYIMILGTNETEDILIKMSGNIALLLDEYPDKAEAELFSGKTYKGIAGIHKSWQEAEDKMMKQKYNVHQTSYFYPYETENRLINALRIGNFEQAERVLWEVRIENEERKVFPEFICKVTTLIYEGFSRFAIEGSVNWTGDDSVYHELVEEHRTTEIWDFLFECINQMEKAFYNEQVTDSIGEQLVVYVQENYTNSNISQQIIADEFQISRTAVSKIFKETTSVNFIEYLHKLRIAHAKQLIEEGNFDVIDVALKSGYEKEITFKRSFIKYEGVSPREYVKHKKRSEKGSL